MHSNNLYASTTIFLSVLLYIFFFNDTATTEIYTLSLHDALPISATRSQAFLHAPGACARGTTSAKSQTIGSAPGDRKSTRLNSSHMSISYAVFCLKKKKKKIRTKSEKHTIQRTKPYVYRLQITEV